MHILHLLIYFCTKLLYGDARMAVKHFTLVVALEAMRILYTNLKNHLID